MDVPREERVRRVLLGEREYDPECRESLVGR